MIELSDEQIQTAPAVPPDLVPGQSAESTGAPAPRATGNPLVTILKHELVNAYSDPLDNGRKSPAGVELAINNASDDTIATAIFDVLFYDGEGNVVDTIKHKIVELPAGRSRAILINSSHYQIGKVVSYDVKLIKTTTAQVEKVQLRRHEIWTTETGEEAIHGIVANISKVKTDAAIVITFMDLNKETIGTRAVVLKDIEPDSIRQYDVLFKPPEGELIAGCTFAIGEIAA
jgi:hypothetical protein